LIYQHEIESFTSQCQFIQPYSEQATETFPHHWEAIILTSQPQVTIMDSAEEFLPKSFYQEESKADRDIRWYNSCYSVGTPAVEDIDMEGIEELEANEEEDNEDLDESHENISQHDQILNLILDIDQFN
jgi:hypothetical protein